MPDLVTVFGGSGFVGRAIVRRFAKAGWRVRVATRAPNEAMFVRTYGAVGQVEPVLCNIRNEDSVANAVKGASAVVNCVGILAQSGKNTFEALQAQGAACIARQAAAHNVKSLVHLSAIGASADSPSEYARTKAAGESGVLSAFPKAFILRPSIVFGTEDQFFNRFAGMTRLSPLLPVVGASTRFQPVYVDDVARAVVTCVTDQNAAPGIYELGGPDVMTFESLMQMMLNVIYRRRLVLNIPFSLARVIATASEIGQFVTGGLVPAALTNDQVANLRFDNVVNDNAKTLYDLGVSATNMQTILPHYLWRFRPTGQYDDIKHSAENLNRK